MLTYKQSGVDISANDSWIKSISETVQGTHGPQVLKASHGNFAGLFRLNNDADFQKSRHDPVLVGCADGVGSKVLLAIRMKNLSTIGIDLVAMNVNDLICCGANPLFFLDYLAVNKLELSYLKDVIKGIAVGCKESGCALLGGETAEMPDLYSKGHIDLAGFAVGVVNSRQLIDGSRIKAGDLLVALPSSGVHSNGYSLVRKLIGRRKLDKKYDELGTTLGEALLCPTRIYVKAVHAVLEAYSYKRVVTGMSHITGGGLRENISRILPKDCDAVIRKWSWKSLPIFDLLKDLGVTEKEMFKVFNMGVGFVLVIRPKFHKGVLQALRDIGENPFLIGHVHPNGNREVLFS